MLPQLRSSDVGGAYSRLQVGGWVTRRHNEVVRAWKRYFEKGGCHSVQIEPVLRPPPEGSRPRPSTNVSPDARADLLVRSTDGRNEFFDVAVLDTGAPTLTSPPSKPSWTTRAGNAHTTPTALPRSVRLLPSVAPSTGRYLLLLPTLPTGSRVGLTLTGRSAVRCSTCTLRCFKQQ